MNLANSENSSRRKRQSKQEYSDYLVPDQSQSSLYYNNYPVSTALDRQETGLEAVGVIFH